MNYEKMSYEELEKLNQGLSNKRDEIKAQQRLIVAAMDKKAVMVEAKRKAALLSEPEKAALSQVLLPEGIESAESVNH